MLIQNQLNVTKNLEIIKLAFEGNTLSRCETFDWFTHFKEVWNSTGNDQRPGRPLTSRTNLPLLLFEKN